MALVTFGQNSRSTNAVAFVNSTNQNLSYGLLHGATQFPSSTKYFTFNAIDELFQSVNLRNDDLYQVNSDGITPFMNDVSELASILTAGTLIAYHATFTASPSGMFTIGSALVSSVYGDGTVAFS